MARSRPARRARIDRPRELLLDARVNGTALEALNRRWGTCGPQARGPVLAPEITSTLTESDGPDVDAKARVSFMGSPRVTSLKLALSEDGSEVKASAERVTIAEDSIEIEDLSVVGAGGDLAGSLLITPRLVTIEARGQNVDLDVLAGLAGLPRGKLGGKLDHRRRRHRGRRRAARARAARARTRLDSRASPGLKLALEATLDDGRVDGSARAEIAGLARAATQFDVALAAGLRSRSLARATGRVEFRLDELDLSQPRLTSCRARRASTKSMASSPAR